MLDVKLVRKSGMEERDMVTLLDKNRTETPTIFLFPEFTFRRKFTMDEVNELLHKVPLEEGSHLFCSAFELENEEAIAKRLEGYGNIDPNDFFSKLFSEPRYHNTGYLVSGTGNGNLISSYRKHVSTAFDSLNGYHGYQDVKTRHAGKNEEEIELGTQYDENVDHSKEKIKFPALSVEGKNLEFRVCADIACGTENNPDIVLVSAHGLVNVYWRSKKTLNGKLIIVNDAGRRLAPVCYKGFRGYGIIDGSILGIFRRRGIKVRKIR